MNTLIYILIMWIGAISTVMTLFGVVFFGYYGYQYVCAWWKTPSDQAVTYFTEFWAKKRKQAIVAALVLFLGLSMPSRGEAVAWYAAYKAANASVWDRLFSSKAAVEEAADSIARRLGEQK